MSPLKEWLWTFFRMVLVAVVTSVVIIFLLVVYSQGAAQQERSARDQQTHLLRAIGCELGVPAVDGTRDPELLRNCWTDEGLEPPAYFNEP